MNASNSPLGAFTFLVAGVLLQALLERFVYPPLSTRYEEAKYRGRQTVNPQRLMLVTRIVNLLLLPAIGFLAGGSLVDF